MDIILIHTPQTDRKSPAKPECKPLVDVNTQTGMTSPFLLHSRYIGVIWDGNLADFSWPELMCCCKLQGDSLEFGHKTTLSAFALCGTIFLVSRPSSENASQIFRLERPNGHSKPGSGVMKVKEHLLFFIVSLYQPHLYLC